MFHLPKKVALEDVTLRDGLQNEDRIFSVHEKLALVRDLIASGVKRIQIGSFVHPAWVPQMSNTDKLFQRLPKNPNVTYTALALNETGLERALRTGVKHLYLGISASETHSRKNNNCTVSEAKKRIVKLIKRTKENNVKIRAGIMMAFGCAYEGKIKEEKVLDIAILYHSLEVDEIDLADTAGLANPKQVFELVTKIKAYTGDIPVSLHLHDTRGMGLANLFAGLHAGISTFDASIGGLGGCPFIPNAAGNIATEDTVFMLSEMGIETGIDYLKICSATKQLETLLGKTLPGRMCHLSENKSRTT